MIYGNGAIACSSTFTQQGGGEVLELLGYTEYTGFSLRYPRSSSPDFIADRVGAAAAELALAAAEIAALVALRTAAAATGADGNNDEGGGDAATAAGGAHTMETLSVLQESEPFPGNDPEGQCASHFCHNASV